MRILMLHNDYLQAGGERFSVRAEARGLTSIGIDVELFEFDNEQFALSAVKSVLKVLDPRETRSQIEVLIRANNPDLVHVQNLFPGLGAGAIQALRSAQIPWVRTMRNYRRRCIAGTCYRDNHDCYRCSDAAHALPGVAYGCYRGSRTQSLGAVTYAKLERRAEEQWPPRAFILLSDAMRPILDLNGGNPEVVVKPNPVDCGIDTVVPQEEREFDGTFVGRLAPEKSPNMILEVAKLLPNRRFALIGNGPQASQIRDAASRVENVEYMGAIPHDAVMSVMGRSRAVLVPSNWQEPFGRTAAEALAVGTPSLVSRRGGLAEIVRPLDEALVVDSNTPSAWSGALDKLLQRGPVSLSALAKDCRARWAQNYEPAANARQLAAIYGKYLF